MLLAGLATEGGTVRRFGRVWTVAVCVATLGAVHAVAVAAPALAGDIPEEEGGAPKVDGLQIIGHYGYHGMKFFQGGYILKQPQLDNFVSIDCGDNGEVNPAGGPDGAPECSFHPGVTEATVTLTGQKPWFDLEPSFDVIPYWSFDDKTYEQGDPITLEAPKSAKTKKEKAGERYLVIGEAVNQKVRTVAEKVRSWDQDTTGKEAMADVKELDQQFDQAKKDLKKLQKFYPKAKQVITEQRKAI